MPRKKTVYQEQAHAPVDEQVADKPTSAEQPHSYAEAVGKKQYVPTPDPFTIATDDMAGVKLRENRQSREMQLLFREKPPQAVIDTVKEHGYRWNNGEKAWTHPVRSDAAMTTRIDAEKLYQDVSKMIRAERGLESSQGITD